MATKSSASSKKSSAVAKKAETRGQAKAKVTPAMDRAKTTAERVQKLREERTRLGLKRLEVYVHPEDWERVKQLVVDLNQARYGADGSEAAKEG